MIACNTASAISLDEVKKEYPLPVIGVLEPGARAAVAATRTRKVGVIGTEATIGSGAYEKAIRKLAPDVEVTSLACPLFVSARGRGVDRQRRCGARRREISCVAFRDSGIDTLVLGCTHYPLLKTVITTGRRRVHHD